MLKGLRTVGTLYTHSLPAGEFHEQIETDGEMGGMRPINL